MGNWATFVPYGKWVLETQVPKCHFVRQCRFVSSATSNTSKPRKTAPFGAQPVSKMYADQPLFGLYGAHCSREQKDLCGFSLFSPELTGTKICVPEKAEEELGKRLVG
jgi:hypothetical protein